MALQDITINNEHYSAWATVAEADSYENGQFGANADAWRVLTDDDTKGRALVSGYTVLSRIQFKDGAEDDAHWQAAIVTANIELAAALNEGSFVQAVTLRASGQKRVKAGTAEVEYFRFFGAKTGPSVALPPSVYNLLKPWLNGASRSGAAGGYASGTDKCSSFDKWYGFRYP